jgi:4-hydroxymandelate synthase
MTMQLDDIDHVEFYVGDAQQHAFYLCTAFGFRLIGQAGPETGLTDQRSLLLRQGRIRLVLTSGLTADNPATRYVSRHGDGVARIAFGTPDAAAAYTAAVAAGGTAIDGPRTYGAGAETVVLAEVGGFGDVTHRFVQRSRAGHEFLPGVMALLGPDPELGDDLLDVVDHIAVCLPAGSLDPTVRFYEEVFGFAQIFAEHIEVGEQAMHSKVVQSPSEHITFTLIEPDNTRRPGQIDDFLARHDGPGVQHLAFLSDDIIGAVRTFSGRGVHFLQTPDSYYDGLESRLGRTDLGTQVLRETNVLVDRDHWGEVFQIFTQSMHVRRTYFMEVIDRHGAKTFGSGNIKALYQAVERERLGAANAG